MHLFYYSEIPTSGQVSLTRSEGTSQNSSKILISKESRLITKDNAFKDQFYWDVGKIP